MKIEQVSTKAKAGYILSYDIRAWRGNKIYITNSEGKKVSVLIPEKKAGWLYSLINKTLHEWLFEQRQAPEQLSQSVFVLSVESAQKIYEKITGLDSEVSTRVRARISELESRRDILKKKKSLPAKIKIEKLDSQVEDLRLKLIFFLDNPDLKFTFSMIRFGGAKSG